MAGGVAIGQIEVNHVTGKVIIYPMGAAPAAGVGPDPDELLRRRESPAIPSLAFPGLWTDLKHGPAKYAGRRRENQDGYHTWTEAETAQFLAFHKPGSKPRLADLLMMNTVPRAKMCSALAGRTSRATGSDTGGTRPRLAATTRSCLN
ncbi:hypothetical protein [Paracoccus aminovorans]|uniref:hypothetical protein n=1 Tax=Paracoccus aminovorans TaxID=34004 RepID=UPI0009EBC919|nr:hypothetical protein [Paracoccus aminovorans]